MLMLHNSSACIVIGNFLAALGNRGEEKAEVRRGVVVLLILLRGVYYNGFLL